MHKYSNYYRAISYGKKFLGFPFFASNFFISVVETEKCAYPPIFRPKECNKTNKNIMGLFV